MPYAATLTRGISRLCSQVVEVAEIWMIFLYGDETEASPGSAGPRRWPEGQLFPSSGSMRLQPTTVLCVSTPCVADRPGGSLFPSPGCWSYKDVEGFSSGDETISSPSATGPRSWQEGQLSSRDVSMSPGQSTTSQWRGGFPAVPAGSDLRDHRLRFRWFLIVYS